MSIILRSLCSFSICIMRINLYNNHSHSDLKLPTPWDRLQLLNISQRYGFNISITLPYISSLDSVIHQALMFLLQFLLSSAINLGFVPCFPPQFKGLFKVDENYVYSCLPLHCLLYYISQNKYISIVYLLSETS